MNREEILKFLEEHESKSSKKQGMSWLDRIMGLLILAGLHTLVPTSEHGLIGELKTQLSVLTSQFQNTDNQVKDHETRLRSLESVERLSMPPTK